MVERWLSRTFSTLALRQRVCLELLLTLEYIVEIGLNAQLAGTFGESEEGKGGKGKTKRRAVEDIVTNITIDGGR